MRRIRALVSSSLHPIPLSATKAFREGEEDEDSSFVEVVVVVDWEGKMSVDGDFGSNAVALMDDGLSSRVVIVARLVVEDYRERN